MPFPPFYAFLYNQLVTLAKGLDIDQFIVLRLAGIAIALLTVLGIYKICRLLRGSRSASIIASCSGTSVAYSMDALVTYDYTPFIIMLITWSLYILLQSLARKQNNGVRYKRTMPLWPAMASLTVVALSISKQNYVLYALIYSIVYISCSNRLDRTLYAGVTLLSTCLYAYWQIHETGLNGLITLYTDASYKGGGVKIADRVANSIATSLAALDYSSLLLATVKIIIAGTLIFLIVGAWNKKRLDTYKGVTESLYLNRDSKVIYFTLTTLTIAVVSAGVLEIIGAIRISSYAFIIMMLALAKIADGGYVGRITIMCRKASLLLLTITILNSMSGSTGALDAYMPLSLCILLSIKICDRSSVSRKSKYLLSVSQTRIVGHISAAVATIISGSISVAALRDVGAKGYTWWGIKENASLEIVTQLLVKNVDKEGYKGRGRNYDGQVLMSERKRQYTDRVVALVASENEAKRKDNILLAFPNIPYFYTAAEVLPYANTPVPWIDVLPRRSSKRIMDEWIRDKPTFVVFAFLPINTYIDQGAGFTSPGNNQSAFITLNLEILRLLLDGYYQIIDGYYNNEYGIYTLAKKTWLDKKMMNTIDNYEVVSLLEKEFGVTDLSRLASFQQNEFRYSIEKLSKSEYNVNLDRKTASFHENAKENLACMYVNVFRDSLEKNLKYGRNKMRGKNKENEQLIFSEQSSYGEKHVATRAISSFNSLLRLNYVNKLQYDCN